MDSPEGTPTERASESVVGRDGDAGRPLRLVPPAVTPVTFADILTGVNDHINGRGRAAFRSNLVSMLDARNAGTYTSFRRALAGCFMELAETHQDEREAILIPAFCSSDYPDTIDGVGLTPIRYDVDPETLATDLSSLKEGLRQNPLAVVTVNVLGYGSPMERIVDLCDEHDAYLVEALGYALGTKYRDTLLGRYGDCSVLNFQQGKPIPIGGGMVVGQHDALDFQDTGRQAVEPNFVALCGYAALARPRPYYAYRKLSDVMTSLSLPSSRDTTHPEPKFGIEYAPPFATISNFQGSIGRRVLDQLADHQRHRQRAAQYYATELSDLNDVWHPTPVDGFSHLQYVRFPLLVETPELRARIKAALNEAGIQATTLYDWPILEADEFPGAARLQDAILTLPTHPYVDARDRRTIVETIRSVLRGN